MTENTKRIPYRLIEQEQDTNSLLIVLPGAGYTTQAPVLYYTTSLFNAKGFDVLHINYSCSQQEIVTLKEEEFAKDVQGVINIALEKREYSNLYIVAKSIGTVALSYLLNNRVFNDAKVVWLTPLLQRDAVYHAMLNNDHQGLCIIGNEDQCYIEERYEELKKNENLHLMLVEGGNHSLELKREPIKSIEILKSIISEIDEF